MIEIRNEQELFDDPIFFDRLLHLGRKILAEANAGEYGVSFLFCDNGAIQKLNSLYRGKDYPTDVLAFSLQEGEPLDFSQMVREDGDEFVEMLGDVVISTEKARDQAKENELSWEGELANLAIHGILHLLGYDHERGEEDAREMFALQDEYLEWFLKEYPDYAMGASQAQPEFPSKA